VVLTLTPTLNLLISSYCSQSLPTRSCS